MTYLDDVLNSPSVEIFPVTVQASWNELEPGYSSAGGTTITSAESIRQIGQQVGPQGLTVVHSIDDGLPDPVTSTGQNDASAAFQMDLVGRPPAVAAKSSLHWNALSTTGSGTGTQITTTVPADVAFWDYVILGITIASASVILTETSLPADTLWPWKLLGSTVDGNFTTFVYGRKHYTSGSVPPVFRVDSFLGYAWVMGSIDVGRTPSNLVMVPITPGDVETNGEVANVTAHAQTPVTVGNRGWNVGVFGGANTAGPWTSSGNTIVGQVAGTTTSTALVTSGLRDTSGVYSMSASSNVATTNVAMVHLALEVRDRPALDGLSYFSTFNKQSPIYGFERDTANLITAINYLDHAAGLLRANTIYNGQMAGVSVSGRTATLQGVSNTRLLLDNSNTLPTVYGWREGMTTDWVAGYLLAQGGQYIGVAPNQYTRWWAPMYGSIHPYADGSACYPVCTEWNVARAGVWRRSAIDTDGPFATAMFAQQTDSSVIILTGTADRTWATDIPGVQDPVLADVFSQQNSVGCVGFWLRADDWVTNPTAVTSGNPDDTLLFSMSLWNNYLGHQLSGIQININAAGNFSVWCGSSGATLNGANITNDHAWHFFGYKWDYHNGVAIFRHNSTTWGLTAQASASDALPSSDAVMYAAGGYNELTWTSHLPIADFQLQVGQPYTDNWPGQFPAPTPGPTFRPTHQPLAVLANPTPVQGWPTLQDLAQSTLSHMRTDENDAAWFVALDYFGETAQMTVDTLNVLDTDFNAGELNAIDDPSQTRNVVTVQFTDTSVTTQRVPILEMSTSLAVPRGVTYITFSLDTPTAETHGAAAWWTSTPEFQKLTASQVAGSTAIQNENVMSVNTLPDGTGTVFVSTSFKARIWDWDSSSITVQFTNTYSSTLYLANNGTQIPFLRALGYAISTADGYVTVRDEGSIGARRERALTTQLNWVNDRATAQEVASTLVTLLARPRPQLTVTVQGDPRRTPGTLCELVDSTGMKADGNWRIYRIQHNYNGPQYTQDLTLIRVGTIGNWDEGLWDESVWGE